MNDDKLAQSLEEKLFVLNSLFAAKLPSKIAVIEDVWQQCTLAPLDKVHWKKLHRLLHTLAGSSGSFGFNELGARAKKVEHAVSTLMQSDGNGSEQARNEFGETLSQFMQYALNATTTP